MVDPDWKKIWTKYRYRKFIKQTRFQKEIQALPMDLFDHWQQSAPKEFPGIPTDSLFFARAAEGLMMFFAIVCEARKIGRENTCGLPSKAADSVWRAWLSLPSPSSCIENFCIQYFGQPIPPLEHEIIDNMPLALATTLVLARRQSNHRLADPSVPPIFALDRTLKMPNSNSYFVRNNVMAYQATNAQGVAVGLTMLPENLDRSFMYSVGLIDWPHSQYQERFLKKSQFKRELIALPPRLFKHWQKAAPQEFPSIPTNTYFFAHAAEGLMMHFDIVRAARKIGREKTCGLPSKAADSIWRAWLSLPNAGQGSSIDRFCTRHFGQTIQPFEPKVIDDLSFALATTLALGRAQMKTFPADTSCLPPIFALDQKLNMPNGNSYRLVNNVVAYQDMNAYGVAIGITSFPKNLCPSFMYSVGLIHHYHYKQLVKSSRFNKELLALPPSLFKHWQQSAPKEFHNIPTNEVFFACAAEGLMMFFDIVRAARKIGRENTCGLPSKAADSVWHAWLSLPPGQGLSLDSFCRYYFGLPIPHVEVEYIDNMPLALATSLALGRKQNNTPPTSLSLPPLFALDRTLKMPEGYAYRIHKNAVALQDMNQKGDAIGNPKYPQHLELSYMLSNWLVVFPGAPNVSGDACCGDACGGAACGGAACGGAACGGAACGGGCGGGGCGG